jgi:hypothetical protein
VISIARTLIHCDIKLLFTYDFFDITIIIVACTGSSL